jgi:hypothetical protein
MGFVAGSTLVLIGVAAVALLGWMSLERGARLTVEHVIGAGRAQSVARQAIDEAMLSEPLRAQMLERIADQLARLDPVARLRGPAHQRLGQFLRLLEPGSRLLRSPRQHGGSEPVHLGGGIYSTSDDPTTILFGSDDGSPVCATEVVRCNEDDIARKALAISSVRVRPIRFTRTGREALRGGTYGMGQGLARAQVIVSVKTGHAVITQQLTLERRFHLKPVPRRSSRPFELCVDTDPTWQEVTHATPLL